MAIKRIQIQGISNAPSDRAIEDGGCSESLNVNLVQNETAPVVPPVDLTAQSGFTYLPPASRNLVYDIVFTHKGNNYTRYICKRGSSLVYWNVTGTVVTVSVIPNQSGMITDYARIRANAGFIAQDIESALNTAGYSLSLSEKLTIQEGLEAFAAGSSVDVKSVASSDAAGIMADINRRMYEYGTDCASASSGFVNIMSLGSETLNDITSVGNTLVIATDKHTHYALYKGGVYVYLGTEIPLPEVVIAAVDEPISDTEHIKRPWGTDGSSDPWRVDIKYLVGDETASEYKTKLVTDYTPLDSYQEAGKPVDATVYPAENEIVNRVHDVMQRQVAANSADGIFNFPVLATYGVKLYDGTVRASVPVLLGAGVGVTHRAIVNATHNYSTTGGGVCHPEYVAIWTSVEYTNAYKVYYKIISVPSNMNYWSDIVSSLDIYFTTPIGESCLGENAAKIHSSTKYTTSDEKVYRHELKLTVGYKVADCITDGIKNAGQFYLMHRIPLTSLATCDYTHMDTSGNTRSEQIATNEKSGEIQYAKGDTTFSRLLSVNNRVLGIVQKKYYNTDMVMLPAARYTLKQTTLTLPAIYENPEDRRYNLSYYTARYNPIFPAAEGYSYGMKNKMSSGQNQITDDASLYVGYNGDATVTIGSTAYYRYLYSLLFCPGEESETGQLKGYTSSVSKFFEFSYKPKDGRGYRYFYPQKDSNSGALFSGIEMPLYTYLQSHGGSGPEWSESADKSDDSYANYLYVSEIDSPFSFPVSGRVRLPSIIKDVASTSVPMSQGQFGEFPLYVFTDDGIYALKSSDVGTVTNYNLISRDIILDTCRPRSIDSQVVFITKKGVMIMTGSQIQCISDDMVGEQFNIDSATAGILDGTSWEKYKAVLTDSTKFMKFMENASIMYDYTGRRLIFIYGSVTGVPACNYQYVYKLNTKTWHKLQQHTATSQYVKRAINSFPDAYAQVNDYSSSSYQTTTRLFNYSTIIDAAAQTADTGVVLTRSLDLGEPDVRKSLNQLRIRGYYDNMDDIKYVLFGSMDRVHWERLTSLRGGSYKYFRVMLLSSLQPNERVSYLELEYDTRWNNKLR